jgi:hypothetical protein
MLRITEQPCTNFVTAQQPLLLLLLLLLFVMRICDCAAAALAAI